MKATLEQLVNVRSQVAEGLIPYLKSVEGEMKKHDLLQAWGKRLDNFAGLLRSAPEAAERLGRFAIAPSEISFPAYVHLRDIAKALRKEDDLRNFLVETKCSPTVSLTGSEYFIAAVLMILRWRFTLSDSLVRYVWEKLREPHSAHEQAILLLFLEGWGEVRGGDEQLTRGLNQLAERPEIALFYVPPPEEGSPWQTFLYWLRLMRRYVERLPGRLLNWGKQQLDRLLNSVKRYWRVYATTCLVLIIALICVWFVYDQPRVSHLGLTHPPPSGDNKKIILSVEVKHTATFFPTAWLWLARTFGSKEKQMLVLGSCQPATFRDCECQAVIDRTPFRIQCLVDAVVYNGGRVSLYVLRPKENSKGSPQSELNPDVLCAKTLTPGQKWQDNLPPCGQ